MSKFSDYTETNIIQSTLRGVGFPIPTGVFISLFTADPTDANVTAGEVQAAAMPAYARQNAAGVGTIDTGWTAPANGVSSNAKAITFAANNGTGPIVVSHIGVYDAAASGNLLYHAPLTTAKTLQVGDVLSFGIGAIVVTVA